MQKLLQIPSIQKLAALVNYHTNLWNWSNIYLMVNFWKNEC